MPRHGDMLATSQNICDYRTPGLGSGCSANESQYKNNFILFITLHNSYMPGYLNRYSVWLRDAWSGFDFRRGLRIVFFATASRPALGPTQPHIQWLPGALSLKVKRRETDHSPPSSAEVKECVELYLHSPSMSPWRGAYLSTGTTLHLSLPLLYL
jgi:hypothetical protein